MGSFVSISMSAVEGALGLSGIEIEQGRYVSAAAPADRLAQLFAAHHRGLYALARRLVDGAEEAEDMVQDTFLRAAGRPRSIPLSDRGAEAWLIRVLINLCRDRYRRKRVQQRALERQTAEMLVQSHVGVDPESLPVTRDLVARALAGLAPRRRAILVFHHLDDLAVSDIAQLLGVTRVTVRWHLSKARRELLRQLEACGGNAAERGGRRS
jgi:RNA polymerase sigma-70 factor (ECF subfamily)